MNGMEWSGIIIHYTKRYMYKKNNKNRRKKSENNVFDNKNRLLLMKHFHQ